MALKKCKECGNKVSTKADKCPNCGAPVKKKTNVGCITSLFIIIIILITIGSFVNFFEKRSSKKLLVEQQKNAAKLEDNNRIEFINCLDQHYEKLVSFCKSKRFDQASRELNLFKKHNKLNYKDVRSIEKKIRVVALEKEVKNIPVAKAADNLRIYKKLLNIDPNNQKYNKKVAFYQAKVNEQRRKEEKEERARQRRIDKFGAPPENSGWDGSVRCVKQYLKEVVLDPDSLKFEKWGTVSYNDNDGWLVWCQYRAKNAFGGYVREIKWFVIRHKMVVAVKERAAYR